ncbi:cytochrome P450 [Pendulispora albinea]|uniref:Cytochrome P450 n=1 Tax=Pendulispora albinea TaxID=2741071 RepID=A0ABZ2LP60_9BACT
MTTATPPVSRPVSRGASLPLAPLVPGEPVIGQLRNLQSRRLTFFTQTMLAYRDIARFRVLNLSAHLVIHPDGVRHMLQENAKNYTKETRGFRQLRLVLGNGLVTSDGEFWLRQRRIAQPAFHKTKISGFADTMVRAAVDLAGVWEAQARRGASLDVAQEMMRVTLRIAGETLLSTDVTGDANSIGASLTSLLANANRRITAPLDLPLHWPTPANVRFRRELRVIDTVVGRIIAERRACPGEKPADLLSMLMDARDESAAPGSEAGMTNEQLRDEVMTMFLAGHETTANALAWTFYCLSKHPSAQRQLTEELDLVLNGRTPALDDVPKLAFTQMVIKESMRLYPPAWAASRRAIDDDALCGYRVPAGDIVFFSPYATHRHPDFWENPEGFDPFRFTPEQEAKRPKFAFLPFGGGPRICIGNAFAMLEVTLVLATLAQRFQLDLVPGTKVEPEPQITLRPRHGLPMTLRRRERVAGA